MKAPAIEQRLARALLTTVADALSSQADARAYLRDVYLHDYDEALPGNRFDDIESLINGIRDKFWYLVEAAWVVLSEEIASSRECQVREVARLVWHVIDIGVSDSTRIATIYAPYSASPVVLYLGDEKAWHINDYRTLRRLTHELLLLIYHGMERAARRAGLIGPAAAAS